mgnify:CR=1 FL=1
MKRLTIEANYLDHAQKQAEELGFYEFPIVDADAHYLMTPLDKLAEYVEEPWKQRLRIAVGNRKWNLIPRDLGDRTAAGRMKSLQMFSKREKDRRLSPNEAFPLVEASAKMGIDYNVVFPTDLLTLGLTTQEDLEKTIAFAYARWMTEEVLPSHESLLGMLYLPLSDPDACVQIIEEFADKPGVVGFMITSTRYQPVHHHCYLPMYHLLEKKKKPLAFHTVSFTLERPFQQLNKFMSVHALGFPLYNMIQATNLVVNGIPERFPDLKIIMVEAGVTWIPFLMSRLDTEYVYRSSEAPLITKLPSEYLRNFYFTSQPLEYLDNMKLMEAVFESFDAENQLLFATDYPHQDFDTPLTIWKLPFLSEEAKRKILGENALKVFNIQNPKLVARKTMQNLSQSGHP